MFVCKFTQCRGKADGSLEENSCLRKLPHCFLLLSSLPVFRVGWGLFKFAALRLAAYRWEVPICTKRTKVSTVHISKEGI